MWNNTKNWIFKILKKSEKYTKTDMIYLAKGGAWLGIGQVVSMFVTLIISIMFANMISPESYGNYKYILSIASLLALSTLNGMDSAVTQSITRGFDGTLNSGLKTKIRWGALGSIASLIISTYYFMNSNITLTVAFIIVAIFLPFIESFDIYNSLLWGKKLFNIQVKYDIVRKIITLIFITAIIYATKNIHIILIIYFLSLVVPNIFFYYKTYKKYQSNDKVDTDSAQYGKNLSMVYIINVILNELDKILVFQHIGATDLARYSIAIAPTDQIKGLMKNINSLAMPQFIQRTMIDIKKTIWKKISVLIIGSILIVVIYILIIPLFFKIFFPKYITSITLSRILSLSLIPVIVSSFLYTVLEAKKAQRQIYQYNIYSGVFGITILFPLIYFYGVWGAIISRIITRTFGLLLSIKLLNSIKT